MAFEPKTWADGVAGGTPITAEELNRMEQGIEDAQNEGLEIAWGDVTGKPATFPPTIGTTGSTAKAGNWNPTIANVTGLEARLTAIENRLDDLENPEE